MDDRAIHIVDIVSRKVIIDYANILIFVGLRKTEIQGIKLMLGRNMLNQIILKPLLPGLLLIPSMLADQLVKVFKGGIETILCWFEHSSIIFVQCFQPLTAEFMLHDPHNVGHSIIVD